MHRRSRVIMLTDDSRDTTRVRQEFSKSDWDADIQEINYSQDAIIALRIHHYMMITVDLAICSRRFDGESIFAFLRKLRSHPHIHRQPLIVYSHEDRDDDMESKCTIFGINGYYRILDDKRPFMDMILSLKELFDSDGRLIQSDKFNISHEVIDEHVFSIDNEESPRKSDGYIFQEYHHNRNESIGPYG
jgi:hypothetical protein